MVDGKELEFNAGDRTFTSKRERAKRSRRSLYRGLILLEDVTSCSTAVANGLSQQIIDEMNLIIPNVLVRFDRLKVSLANEVFPYLQRAAKEALFMALNERGKTIRINSAYRTIAQQLILFNHAQHGRCGIKIAARPGCSNHQSGLAIDIDDASSWRPYLERYGWRWLGSQDPPHFDYVGKGTIDIRSLAVLAFQKLWNKNNQSDRLVEDSLYGPQVEARLNRSPIEGFGVIPPGNLLRILKLTTPLMHGADVRALQQALVKEGFTLAVDGFYGKETKMAVKQFQKRTGLMVDGVFGSATHRKLFRRFS